MFRIVFRQKYFSLPTPPFLKTSSNRAQACFHTDRRSIEDRSGTVVYLGHAKFLFFKDNISCARHITVADPGISKRGGGGGGPPGGRIFNLGWGDFWYIF